MSYQRRDIGALIKGAFAIPHSDAVAAGTGDATEVDGVTIDRQAYGSMYPSAKLIVSCQATLTSGKLLAIAANFQDSPNDSDWADHGTALAATTILTGPSGGGEVQGVAELDVSLADAKRYIRVQVTPDLDASATDTSEISAVVVLGGAETLPAA